MKDSLRKVSASRSNNERCSSCTCTGRVMGYRENGPGCDWEVRLASDASRFVRRTLCIYIQVGDDDARRNVYRPWTIRELPFPVTR